MKALQADVDLARLDSLISELDHVGDNELLLEHLQSARTYLLGAMPAECALSLDFAGAAAQEVRDASLRNRIQEEIKSLMDGKK